MPEHPYRIAQEEKRLPARHVYTHVDRATKQSTGGLALVQLLAMPLAAAALVYTFQGETAALIVLGAGFAGMYIWWKRRSGGSTFALTIEHNQLQITSSQLSPRTQSVPLGDILAVELETKTIQRVGEGGSAIPAMRFLEPTVGVEVDTCRIAVHTRTGTILLGEKYIAHMDAVENVGKLRVFLRKNGWLPEAERDA